MGNPLNKTKQKIQTKTKTPPTSTTQEAVDELLAKLQPHNLTISDASTAAKYYYNQSDLALLNPDQLARLQRRLIARAESEASVQPTEASSEPTQLAPPEAPKEPEPIQGELLGVVAAPLIEASAPTPEEPPTPEIIEPSPEPITTNEETTMSAIEQSTTVVPESVLTTSEPVSIVEAPQEAPIVVVEVSPEVEVASVAPVILEATPELPAVVAEAAPSTPEVAISAPVPEEVVAAPLAEPEPEVVAAAVEPEPEIEEESEPEPEPEPEIMEPRYWKKNGWSAKVIKNEDDDGWAVEICKDGLPDPVLVSPWVMGRDKKNPKPFDSPSFTTFVKTASEVMRRAAQQRERQLKKSVSSCWDGVWYKILLEITPDEFEPYATLSATNDEGEVLAKVRVAPNYKFSQAVADKWVRGGFKEQ